MDHKRNIRKWCTLAAAAILYFVVHEGAHWLYAVSIGAFRRVNIIGGIGIQIEPVRESMSDVEFGIFNLISSVATLAVGYALLAMTPKLLTFRSAYARAVAYFTTIVFLIVDPLYMCVLSLFVGGGDMNGIAMLASEPVVRIVAGVIAAVNIFVVLKYVVPRYRDAYNRKQI